MVDVRIEVGNDILNNLWRIAEKEAERTGTSFSFVFDSIGLRLHRPLENYGYESTPRNSLSFADTGGDGVHYSLVCDGEKVSDLAPVVMTVPMNFGRSNLILGSCLHEFLCLGCQIGYFSLEQLTYGWSEAVYWISHPDEFFKAEYPGSSMEDTNNEEKSLLSMLRRELQLEPWEKPEKRLMQLYEAYFPMLDFSPGMPDCKPIS